MHQFSKNKHHWLVLSTVHLNTRSKYSHESCKHTDAKKKKMKRQRTENSRERRHFCERRTCICHVLCVRRLSVDSRVLLDPRSRCFGSAIVLPRRYSGSKMLILAETVLIHGYVKGEAGTIFV